MTLVFSIVNMYTHEQPWPGLYRWHKQQRTARTYVLLRRHFFLGLDRRRACALRPVPPEPPRKTAQKAQPDTLGEGGSMSGATSLVRNTCWLLRRADSACFCLLSLPFLLRLSPPPPARRSMPTLLECRSSGCSASSAAPAFASASASVRKRSSQTRPDEPDRLNVVADLCNPAMGDGWVPPIHLPGFPSPRDEPALSATVEENKGQ
jgi:hypothetical protein|uniref:Uncharacterized protein n=1 Tax=Zea mays TaxID=4577 RepID=C0PF99_MAIZE|nr:unknown [Zea mays]